MRKNNFFIIFMISLFSIAPTWPRSSNGYTTKPGIGSGFFDRFPGEFDCEKNVSVVVQEKSRGPYTVKISRDPEFFCEILEIQKNGLPLFRDFVFGGHFGAEQGFDDDQFFRSLNGPNSENIVVSNWTGGMHCCYSLRIFDITDEFHEIFFSEFGNSQPQFADFNRDGIYEIEASDDFLAEQFSCYAESAMPTFVLKYDGETYVPAIEYMRRSPKSLSIPDAKIQEWRKHIAEDADTSQMPYDFMQMITDQFYTNSTDKAYELIDLVWPVTGPSKEDFIRAYEESFADSRFYSQIQKAFVENFDQ